MLAKQSGRHPVTLGLSPGEGAVVDDSLPARGTARLEDRPRGSGRASSFERPVSSIDVDLGHVLARCGHHFRRPREDIVSVPAHDLGWGPGGRETSVFLGAHLNGTALGHELGYLAVGVSPAVEPARAPGKASRNQNELATFFSW